MSKKNVLLIINQLYGGGAQRVIANLSIEFSRLFNVTIVIYNDIDKVVFDYRGDLVKINLPYTSDRFNNSLYKRLARFVSLTRQIKKIKKEKKIDVAISFMEASNFVNILSAVKEKTIISVRSYLSHEFDDNPRLKIFKPLIKLLYNRANVVVVPAQLTGVDLVENFGVDQNKIRVIYNFIDKEVIVSLAKKAIQTPIEQVYQQRRTIVNIGRFNQQKAQHLLPAVLKEVHKTYPGVKMIILGDGPLKEKIIKEAVVHGLTVFDNTNYSATESTDILQYDIYLVGFAENPYPYLLKSQIFIKSSIFEGFPNVVIEAMTLGLPVISTDCASGPREILSPFSDVYKQASEAEYSEYGILVPTFKGDEASRNIFVKASAGALTDLLANEDKRRYYTGQSKKRTEDFTRDKIIGEWIDLVK